MIISTRSGVSRLISKEIESNADLAHLLLAFFRVYGSLYMRTGLLLLADAIFESRPFSLDLSWIFRFCSLTGFCKELGFVDPGRFCFSRN